MERIHTALIALADKVFMGSKLSHQFFFCFFFNCTRYNSYSVALCSTVIWNTGAESTPLSFLTSLSRGVSEQLHGTRSFPVMLHSEIKNSGALFKRHTHTFLKTYSIFERPSLSPALLRHGKVFTIAVIGVGCTSIPHAKLNTAALTTIQGDQALPCSH